MRIKDCCISSALAMQILQLRPKRKTNHTKCLTKHICIAWILYDRRFSCFQTHSFRLIFETQGTLSKFSVANKLVNFVGMGSFPSPLKIYHSKDGRPVLKEDGVLALSYQARAAVDRTFYHPWLRNHLNFPATNKDISCFHAKSLNGFVNDLTITRNMKTNVMKRKKNNANCVGCLARDLWLNT